MLVPDWPWPSNGCAGQVACAFGEITSFWDSPSFDQSFCRYRLAHHPLLCSSGIRALQLPRSKPSDDRSKRSVVIKSPLVGSGSSSLLRFSPVPSCARKEDRKSWETNFNPPSNEIRHRVKFLKSAINKPFSVSSVHLFCYRSAREKANKRPAQQQALKKWLVFKDEVEDE